MSYADNSDFPGTSAKSALADAMAPNHAFVRAAETGLYRHIGKRLMDIVIVLCSLPLLLPIMAALALLVACDGQNPLYGHMRVGRDGKPFRCWKFRSMVPDAAARLKDHLEKCPLAKLEWETTFKLLNDPRITRLGHTLRRSSLDELPQLWNILIGEMSIVGPRPVTKEELPLYKQDLPLYQAVRPGLTGLWQVNGRNDLSYDERVALDVRYVRSFNLVLDLRVVVATANAVLHRTGR